MRRKVINISGNTMMVSLPHKWVKNMGVKKGDEIEIQEKDRSLIVSTDLKPQQKSIEFDATNYDQTLARVIGALYKKGYDEVKIRVNGPKQVEQLAETARDELVGFEMLEQKASYCRFKDVSGVEDQDFDSMLNRLFFILEEFINRIISCAGNKLEDIDSVILTDINVNRFATLCRRLTNKYGYGAPINTPFLYYILESLERIGDELKSLCRTLKETTYLPDKHTMNLFSQTNTQLRLFRELFFDFSSQKFEQFYNSQRELIKSITDEDVGKSVAKAKILSNLRTLNQFIHDMNGALIALKI